MPIKTKKELEHKTVPRGTSDVLYNYDQVLVGWKDNKAVYMASNVHSAATNKTCRRYSRTEKRELQVSFLYNYMLKKCTGILFFFYLHSYI